MTVARERAVNAPDAESALTATRLRVRVLRATEPHAAVNVTIPIGVAAWGIKTARMMSPELKELDLDWDSLERMVGEGARGQLVHVDDTGTGEIVDIWLE